MMMTMTTLSQAVCANMYLTIVVLNNERTNEWALDPLKLVITRGIVPLFISIRVQCRVVVHWTEWPLVGAIHSFNPIRSSLIDSYWALTVRTAFKIIPISSVWKLLLRRYLIPVEYNVREYCDCDIELCTSILWMDNIIHSFRFRLIKL
jgi:hypothetical protein